MGCLAHGEVQGCAGFFSPTTTISVTTACGSIILLIGFLHLETGHEGNGYDPCMSTEPLFRILPHQPARRESATTPGYGYLPVELFDLGDRWYAFDARNVSFLELNREAFDILKILRERSAEPGEILELLSQHNEQNLREALEQISTCQTEGWLTPYRFQRAKRHDNDQYERILSEGLGRVHDLCHDPV